MARRFSRYIHSKVIPKCSLPGYPSIAYPTFRSPRDSNPITAESILPFSSLRRIRSLHNFLPRSLSIFSQLTRRLSYTNAPREFRYLERPLRDRLCTLVQRFPIPQSETLQLNVACYLLLEWSLLLVSRYEYFLDYNRLIFELVD